VRVKACADDDGTLRLVATSRAIGPEPESWRAVSAPLPHPGPSNAPGAKLTHRAFLERSQAFSAEQGVDETVLFDARGWLVEGSRSNLLVVDADGALSTPDPTLGAVAGIALEVCRERIPEIGVAEIDLARIRRARELIAVNAVRGAVPIRSLDAAPLGAPEPGPVARRLAAALAR